LYIRERDKYEIITSLVIELKRKNSGPEREKDRRSNPFITLEGE